MVTNLELTQYGMYGRLGKSRFIYVVVEYRESNPYGVFVVEFSLS